MSRTPPQVRRGPAEIGEHSREVLLEAGFFRRRGGRSRRERRSRNDHQHKRHLTHRRFGEPTPRIRARRVGRPRHRSPSPSIDQPRDITWGKLPHDAHPVREPATSLRRYVVGAARQRWNDASPRSARDEKVRQDGAEILSILGLRARVAGAVCSAFSVGDALYSIKRFSLTKTHSRAQHPDRSAFSCSNVCDHGQALPMDVRFATNTRTR
jgi:hypothetical protein